MNRYLAFASALVLAAIAIPSQAAPPGAPIRLTPAQSEALELRMETLKRAKRGEGRQLPAHVVLPNADVRVVSIPASGFVQDMKVSLNQPVAKGQPLAHIQSAMAMGLQREYLQALQQARLMRESLERDEALFRAGIVAQSRYQSSRAAALQAEAEANERRRSLLLTGLTEAAVQALEQKGEIRSDIDVLSPLAGIVLEQFVTTGQRVDANTPLYKIGRLSDLLLEIQVPATEAAEVEVGMTVRIPAVRGSARIASVGRNVNPQNQTVTAIARVTDQGEHLSPNEFVQVVMDLVPLEPDTWLVPNGAIARTGGRAYLFVWSAPGYVPTGIAVLQESVTQSLVRGPMQPGDRIVVKGTAALKAVWLQRPEAP